MASGHIKLWHLTVFLMTPFFHFPCLVSKNKESLNSWTYKLISLEAEKAWVWGGAAQRWKHKLFPFIDEHNGGHSSLPQGPLLGLLFCGRAENTYGTQKSTKQPSYLLLNCSAVVQLGIGERLIILFKALTPEIIIKHVFLKTRKQYIILIVSSFT